MERHVNAISKACYYQIRNIGNIRWYIALDACKPLAHALITSQLDYGNALLYGLPSKLVTRLQKVQNYSAKLVTRTHERDHITPVLNSLLWKVSIYYVFGWKELCIFKDVNPLHPYELFIVKRLRLTFLEVI